MGDDIVVDLFVRSSPRCSQQGRQRALPLFFPPAAIVFPARCHYWQRPLPISSPSAANGKGVAFFPLRCGLVPICRRLFPLIPAAVGKREAFRAAWLFLCAHKQVNCYIITLPYSYNWQIAES